MQKYVVYTRVSTDEQGRSGLGLDAQRRDIELFLKNFSEVPYEVVGRFEEVGSGRNDERPQLALALGAVKRTGAELLVSKLDRLSRDVEFIAGTMKRAAIRIATMPHADPFQMHLYAALAEQERSFISARTRAALRAARARGTKLGGIRPKTEARNVAVREKARAEAERVMKVVGPMRRDGATLAAIASTLNETGVPTSRGGSWTATQVSRVIERVG